MDFTSLQCFAHELLDKRTQWCSNVNITMFQFEHIVCFVFQIFCFFKRLSNEITAERLLFFNCFCVLWKFHLAHLFTASLQIKHHVASVFPVELDTNNHVPSLSSPAFWKIRRFISLRSGCRSSHWKRCWCIQSRRTMFDASGEGSAFVLFGYVQPKQTTI